MSNQKVIGKVDFRKGNPSGFRPKGHAVLVKPIELQKAKSLIQLPETVKDRQKMIEDRVIVVALGAACWNDEDEPRAQIGEVVLISKFAGIITTGPLDGETYRIVNDKDIYVGLDPAVDLEK